MEAKHTEGPWEAPSAGVYGPDGLLICSLGSPEVVEAYRKRGDTNGAIIAANARLIASSPELLEALKLFMDIWNSGDSISDSKKAKLRRAAMWKKAVAAIAKVEGKR